jgi:hypothetical protein
MEKKRPGAKSVTDISVGERSIGLGRRIGGHEPRPGGAREAQNRFRMHKSPEQRLRPVKPEGELNMTSEYDTRRAQEVEEAQKDIEARKKAQQSTKSEKKISKKTAQDIIDKVTKEREEKQKEKEKKSGVFQPYP